MRPPVDHIEAPEFPPRLPWINTPPLTFDGLAGSAVMVEFWDFCRANSIRTLPYLKAWHARYADAGLTVIAVHAAGFEPSQDPEAVRAAVARLAIAHPVVVDGQYEIWRRYGNLGWPARYLFNDAGRLAYYHYGEGEYADSERAIQELVGIKREPLAPLRPEDVPGAALAPQSEDVEGPYRGSYEAGGVWAVLDGHGAVTVNGRGVSVAHPGAYELLSHPRSTAGELDLSVGDGVRCHAVCFTPGLAS